MLTISEITPIKRWRVIDLVGYLGIDVAPWGEFKGGRLRAATNPKYCYEWAFNSDPNLIVVNFWTHQLVVEADRIVWRRELKDFTQNGNATQQARGKRLEVALKRAFTENLPVHVIICHGTRRRDGGKSVVEARDLDVELWAVTAFDARSGICEVTRGVVPSSAIVDETEAKALGFEGREAIRWFIRHRVREWKHRQSKIEDVLKTEGTLRCEVPRCGFDFAERYGSLGLGFAHVHHKQPICTFPPEGKIVAFDELIIVCANCHNIIHRGGQCRDIKDLIPE